MVRSTLVARPPMCDCEALCLAVSHSQAPALHSPFCQVKNMCMTFLSLDSQVPEASVG